MQKNKYGVVFSDEEINELKETQRMYNEFRSKTLSELSSETYVFADEQRTEISIKELRKMGIPIDFLLSERNKSIDYFKSHEQLKRYLESLKAYYLGNAFQEKIQFYKDNFLKAIDVSAGGAEEKKKVKQILSALTPTQISKLMNKYEIFNLTSIYPQMLEKSDTITNILNTLNDMGLG